MPVVWLRVPAEYSARVRGIVRQLEAAGTDFVHAQRNSAAEFLRAGHRIAVRIPAAIVEAAPAHVIARGHRRVAILSVEPFRRRFDQKRRAGDVARVETRGPRNVVLEESAPSPIQLAVEYRPLL